MILQTHHAAFDGISAPPCSPRSAGAYTERADLARHRPPIRRRWTRKSLAGTGHACQVRGTGGSPARLPVIAARLPERGNPDCPAGGEPGPARVRFVLTSMPVPRPPAEGHGPHPTVNDLLVAALILTVDRWNAAHGHAAAGSASPCRSTR